MLVTFFSLVPAILFIGFMVFAVRTLVYFGDVTNVNKSRNNTLIAIGFALSLVLWNTFRPTHSLMDSPKPLPLIQSETEKSELVIRDISRQDKLTDQERSDKLNEKMTWKDEVKEQ